MSLPWFKFNPQDFLEGVVDLSLEERGAYITVLGLIYQRAGAVPDEPRWLAGHCLVSVRRWTKIRAALIEKGKLYVDRDGRLMNDRANRELEKFSKPSRNVVETSSKVEDKSAETTAEINVFNEIACDNIPDAAAKITSLDRDRDREGSEANASSPGRTKGRRLPANWSPTEADTAFALDQGLSPQEIDRGADEFRDYWSARAGSGATKLDWSATWRNRVRDIADRKRRSGPRLAAVSAEPGGRRPGAVSFADIYARRHGQAKA